MYVCMYVCMELLRVKQLLLATLTIPARNGPSYSTPLLNQHVTTLTRQVSFIIDYLRINPSVSQLLPIYDAPDHIAAQNDFHTHCGDCR
jgi:hypothetical protein